MGMNVVFAAGNLTKDPQLKETNGGLGVVNFTIASNYFKNQEPAVEFINCVAFGKQAQSIAKYKKSGSFLVVQGHLNTSSYEKDGQKRYSTSVIVDRAEFGPRTDKETHTPQEFKETSNVTAQDVPF